MENVRKRQLFTRRSRAAARAWRCVAAVVSCAALAACSPTYNWREVHVEGDLAATLPCKPDDDHRRVAVAGRALDMRLLSCEAGGAIWALATTDAKEVGAVADVLASLQSALGANIGATASLTGPVAMAGATPFPAAGRFAAEGKRRDGSPVQIDAWVFARGTRIYQASVVRPGPASGPLLEAQEQFFSSLGFPALR